jgi:hypothetical protein
MAAARPAPSPLFDAHDPERVAAALHDLGDGLLVSLGAELRGALEGSDTATRAYVRDYRRLAGCVLAEARRTRPELVVGDTHFFGAHPATVIAVIEHASAAAPFTPWAAHFELTDAVGLDLTNRVRIMLGARPLSIPTFGAGFAPAVDDIAARRFLRYVRHHLNHPEDEEPLARLMDSFGLTKTELAGLFGVRRQAIDGWLAHGVPAERQEKLVALLDIAHLLERKLKAERLPGVARRAAEAYGGETMLDLIAADRHRELLESVRASFDWARAA